MNGTKAVQHHLAKLEEFPELKGMTLDQLREELRKENAPGTFAFSSRRAAVRTAIAKMLGYEPFAGDEVLMGNRIPYLKFDWDSGKSLINPQFSPRG